jgi:hypothetical protein
VAKSKIIEGLKQAVRHARCANRHVPSHVTTKTDDHEWTTECMKCGHSWTYEDRADGLRLIRPTKGKTPQ